MTNNTQLIAINHLQPIAKRMRERQEQIDAIKDITLGKLGEIVALIAEQGQDIVLTKTKLGKSMSFSEWLKAHVPNLPEPMAARYERVTTEQLSDPRQVLFAFLPAEHRESGPKRIPPAAWEQFAGLVAKASKTLRVQPIETWPTEQKEASRGAFEPVARALWPEKFE